MRKLLHYEPKTEFLVHQRKDLDESWDAEQWGWLWEMGAGKSKQCIDNLCMLREVETVTHALFFAPKGTYFNWTTSEIPKHMPDRHLNSTLVHLWTGGGTKTEQRILERLLEKDDVLKLLVVNTEAISASEKARNYVKKFMRAGRVFLAVDESSAIKNRESNRTKFLLEMREWATWRRILTGTPVTRDPLDLFAQFEFLKAQYFGFRSFYSFRERYAIVQEEEINDWSRKDDLGQPAKKTIKVVVAHRNTEELGAKVANWASIVKKEDCLDLPPKTYHVRHVQLTKEQERLYKELKDFATTEVAEGKFVTVQQAIVMYMRLNQIVCGHVRDEEGTIHEIPTNKISELEAILEEIDGRCIIWCQYRNDVDIVEKHLRSLGKRVATFHGGMSQNECQEAVFQFQGVRHTGAGEERCPDALRKEFFVATISKGAYGITLTAANTEVYYSCGPDAEKRWQSEDRAHRIGQTKSVAIIDLVAKGTVEEKNADLLRRKKSLADVIADGPARLREFFD